MTLDPRETGWRTARMTSPGTSPDSARAAADALCLSCGLCCGGPFFGFVELQPGDDAAALGALLPLERKGDQVVFKLPCPALKGACCSIYSRRPQICRGYRCRVLRRVEEEPGELPGALEKARTLVASFTELKELLGTSGFMPARSEVLAAFRAFRVAYRAALEAGDGAFLTRHRELILRWKRTVWLLHVFDEKVAARLALPVHKAGAADAPR
jgi:Fe-S-cluster containining protein